MFHALLMVVFLGPKWRLRLLRTGRPGLQIVRSLLLLAATLLFFNALKYIPIADATTLAFFNVPLVAVLSALLLKEAVDRRHWLAVAAGFAGVLIVLRPGFAIIHPGAFFALGMAVSYAFFQIVTRKLTDTENAVTTLFYTALVGTIGTSFLAPFVWVTPAPVDWLIMAAVGVLGGTGHFLLIKALEQAPASVIAPFGYTPLIWVTAGGYLLFGNFPDGWTLAGAAVIISSGMYLASRQRRAR
jgi:drug/metabolite transporter (DMT)-like permease